MQIRPATIDDLKPLTALSAGTFVECFGYLYTAENLNAFLKKWHSEDYYSQQLQKPDHGILLAEEGAELLGYIQTGEVKLPTAFNPEDAEIQRLYCAANSRGKGIGRRLMQTAIDKLEFNGRKRIFLGVWEENHGAQRFYRSFGFEKCGEYLFYVGEHADQEWIMMRP